MTTKLLFISLLATATSLQAQQTSMSKQEFIDAQINAATQAQKIAKEREENNIAMLKKALPPEDFEKLMAADEATKIDSQNQMAECLGVSRQDIEKYEASFDAEFQIELVKTCSADLPETISLEGNQWGENADLAAFQACAENEVAKHANIPKQRLLKCSQELEENDQ